MKLSPIAIVFFFNDTATTEIYTLSLHDALPIYLGAGTDHRARGRGREVEVEPADRVGEPLEVVGEEDHRSARHREDRKSTRLNSSHANISYAVFCLKKKKTTFYYITTQTNRLQS